MTMLRLFALVVIAPLAFGAAGCPPTPQPPPSDADATPTLTDTAPEPELDSAAPKSACEVACKRMASIPCKEGIDSMCVPTCTHVSTTKLTAYDVGCIALASSADDVRKCRGGKCTAP